MTPLAPVHTDVVLVGGRRAAAGTRRPRPGAGVPPDPGDELPREILQPWRDDIVRLQGGWRPAADVVASSSLVDGWSLQDRGDHFNLGPGREMLLWISGREGLALTTEGWRRLGMPADTESNVDHRFVAALTLAWVDRQIHLGSGGDPLAYDTSDAKIYLRQMAADELAGRHEAAVRAGAKRFGRLFRRMRDDQGDT